MLRNIFGEYMKEQDIRKEFLKQTGIVISSKRKRKNITQQALGDVLDVSKATISRYESGQLDMPLSNLPIISDFCDFRLRDYLIQWESLDIKSFIKKALSFKDLVPKDSVVQEYIDSCNDNEIQDLLEIDYCINNLYNEKYNHCISDTIIYEHIQSLSVKQAQYKRLLVYYEKLCEIKNASVEGD